MESLAFRRSAAPSVVPEGATREFRAHYDAHFAFVWRTLLRFGVPEAVAEDAAQEVFMTLHRRLPDYDASMSMRGWLWGMCRRVAHTHRRTQARAERRESVAPAPSPPSLPPDAALERRQAADLVEAFLAGLGEDLREVFVLMEIEGMSAPEVALTVGAGVNTVYSRLRLARERFRREVQRLQAREGSR